MSTESIKKAKEKSLLTCSSSKGKICGGRNDIIQKSFRSHTSNHQGRPSLRSQCNSLCFLEATISPEDKSVPFQRNNNYNNAPFMPCPVNVSQTAAFLFLPCRETCRLDRADRCCPSQRYFIHTSLWNNVNSARSFVLFILQSILKRTFTQVSHWLNFVLRPFFFFSRRASCCQSTSCPNEILRKHRREGEGKTLWIHVRTLVLLGLPAIFIVCTELSKWCHFMALMQNK